MEDIDLRKLSRADLLEMLIAQSKEVEQLKTRLQAAEDELAGRQLISETSGSIAQEALRLNGVFEAAQRAADQYLESARLRAERVEEDCTRREQECTQRVEQLLADAYERCIRLEEYTQKACEDALHRAGLDEAAEGAPVSCPKPGMYVPMPPV